MFFIKKIFKHKILVFYIFLISCQFQEPNNNHGIVFLENRANTLIINRSNTNDVIKKLGQPHTKSIKDSNKWLYIERVLSKGEYHKLGKNILKKNNVLILTFDKYGVLINKELLKKDDKNKLAFTNKSTENKITQKSFVEKFLSSVKQKMYGNK